MTRVCIVTPRYPPNKKGGGEISCSLLARELSTYVDVEVVSFDGNVTSKSVVDGVKVIRKKPIAPHELKTPVNLQAYQFLKKKIEDYDIFHTYNHDLMPAIGLLTKCYGVKSVATLNGSVYFSSIDPSGWYQSYKTSLHPKTKLKGLYIISRNKIMLPAIKNINAFTALSPFNRDKFVEEGLPSNKIRVMTNMLDSTFIPLKKEEDDIAKILYIGNFTFGKGVDTLISAYSRLEKQDIELVIAGDNATSKVDELIKKLKPKNKVRFLGKVAHEKTPELYAKADIFVVPYPYPYPIGRTILEALRSGVCVISTGNGYYSPIIKDMKSGVLIYPCTAEKLSEKIQMLIDKPDLREKLAKNGQRRVEEVCAPEKIIKEYISIYEGLK
jgi:glycosyltransferase involved in cell wall biosynthesis